MATATLDSGPGLRATAVSSRVIARTISEAETTNVAGRPKALEAFAAADYEGGPAGRQSRPPVEPHRSELGGSRKGLRSPENDDAS